MAIMDQYTRRVEEIKSLPHVPMSHPFVEQLIGSVRRKLLDQMATTSLISTATTGRDTPARTDKLPYFPSKSGNTKRKLLTDKAQSGT